MLRLQIVDDRARIGEKEAVVVHRRHLAERRGRLESGVGVADSHPLQLEIDPLLTQIAEQLPHERRHHRSIDYHHPLPLRSGGQNRRGAAPCNPSGTAGPPVDVPTKWPQQTRAITYRKSEWK